MSKLNKDAQKIMDEFLPTGRLFGELAYKLHTIGAHQSARLVSEASDLFHEDVERIINQRKKI